MHTGRFGPHIHTHAAMHADMPTDTHTHTQMSQSINCLSPHRPELRILHAGFVRVVAAGNKWTEWGQMEFLCLFELVASRD